MSEQPYREFLELANKLEAIECEMGTLRCKLLDLIDKLEKADAQSGDVGRSVAPIPYAAIDFLVTEYFGWPWKPAVQKLYAGICDLFETATASLQTPKESGNRRKGNIDRRHLDSIRGRTENRQLSGDRRRKISKEQYEKP